MSADTWILYGFPALGILLAVAGILFARQSATSFDRRFGRDAVRGAAAERAPLAVDIHGLSPRGRAEIERILRREGAGRPASPPRHAAE